jgi:hypothetical protein
MLHRCPRACYLWRDSVSDPFLGEAQPLNPLETPPPQWRSSSSSSKTEARLTSHAYHPPKPRVIAPRRQEKTTLRQQHVRQHATRVWVCLCVCVCLLFAQTHTCTLSHTLAGTQTVSETLWRVCGQGKDEPVHQQGQLPQIWGKTRMEFLEVFERTKAKESERSKHDRQQLPWGLEYILNYDIRLLLWGLKYVGLIVRPWDTVLWSLTTHDYQVLRY